MIIVCKGTATLGGIQLISRGKYKNRYVAVSANEFVIIWDTKKEDKDAEVGAKTIKSIRPVVTFQLSELLCYK